MPYQLKSASFENMKGASAKIEQSYLEAVAWDDGCAVDSVRNEYIIPFLVKLLTRERKPTILDIGTGTGYIPRSVDTMLTYRPHWTLVDTEPNRILVAEQRLPSDMQCTCLIGDIARIAGSGRTFDAVLLTFTLLETRDAEVMLDWAIQSLSEDGVLVVVIPDVWRDALAAAQIDPSVPHRLLDEAIDMRKIDKFTGSSYPFFALRTETLISTVLKFACVLENLLAVGCQNEAFLLIFRKQASSGECEGG